VIPRPVFGHGLAFVSSGFESPSLLAIRPDGRGDVTTSHVAWTLRKGAPLTPSPLLVDDELYLVSDSGIASCVDARTAKATLARSVNPNPESRRVLGNIFGLGKGPSDLGNHLLKQREFRLNRKRPSIAGILHS
jgi:hypothetical protein